MNRTITDSLGEYYETHVVVTVVEFTENTFEQLQKLNDKINSHLLLQHKVFIPLSINMKKMETNQVFITLRHYLSTTSREELDLLVVIASNIITKEFPILKTIKETVLYDSNPLVDSQII